VEGKEEPTSLIAPMSSEIDQLSSSFEFSDFSFASRTTNKVAREYAR
jgi:hypothetical protein